MQLARARRQLPQQDSLLRNYRARAEGFVYFYLDRRETDERTLVKTDQVALEIFWAPPNRTKQRIIGLRDESRLPNRMYYHLDHLTVVQDGFGDIIRMGDGDEVADVPHPVAMGSDSVYAFRLADSLSIRLPGQGAEIRVYEVEVRPRRTDRSALVGSLFVDRRSGDVVRMTFTFTPVSYVDRRLDYISVSLDNGLWEGRYWLPNEQTLQIRRQIPELDFAAGAVIQGRMRILDYTFNDTISATTFVGSRVVAVPEAQRREFTFEKGLYDDLNDAGLSPPPDLAEIRRQAASLLGTPRLSGLPSWRLNLESASAVLHYNRVEGLTPGLGVSYVPGPPWRADFAAGYAFGPDRPWLSATLRRELPERGDVLLRVRWRELVDVGVAPGVPPAINTLTGMFAGDDFLDPYYSSGLQLMLRRTLRPRWQGSAELRLEQQRSALLTQRSALFSDSALFRPVRAIDEGDAVALIGTVRRSTPDPRATDWGGTLRVEAGSFEGTAYIRPTVDAIVRRASADQRRALLLRGAAGYVSIEPPSQRLFVLGGTNTLPGYDYRSFAGRSFGSLQAEATTSLVEPWLSLRILGAAAVTGGLPSTALDVGTRSAWKHWNVTDTDGIRTSFGVGASLLWDLLRLDAVRGLNGGKWRVQVSFHREFWDIS